MPPPGFPALYRAPIQQYVTRVLVTYNVKWSHGLRRVLYCDYLLSISKVTGYDGTVFYFAVLLY